MSGVQQLTVTEDESGQRLDRWFKKRFPAVTQGQLQKLLRTGQVRVDGGRAKADHRLDEGATIRVPPITATPATSKNRPQISDKDKQLIQEAVLLDQGDLLVLNKPFGLAVQGGAGQTRHIDGMLDVLGKGERRPRLVHRLDRDTGGVLVLARTRKLAAFLMEAFKDHAIEKIYWALTKRVPTPLEGRIDLAIGKEPTGGGGRELVQPQRAGKKALTDYQTVEMAGQKAAFLAVRPATGRTHQIRVHLAAIKTPIVGDRKYGGPDAVVPGIDEKMHLFCRSMTVPMPSGPPVTISAPLTGHMARTWSVFDFAEPGELDWPPLP